MYRIALSNIRLFRVRYPNMYSNEVQQYTPNVQYSILDVRLRNKLDISLSHSVSWWCINGKLHNVAHERCMNDGQWRKLGRVRWDHGGGTAGDAMTPSIWSSCCSRCLYSRYCCHRYQLNYSYIRRFTVSSPSLAR